MAPKKSLRLKMMKCKFLAFILVMTLLPVVSIQVDSKEVVNSQTDSLDRLLVYEETDGQLGVLKADEEQALAEDSDEIAYARSEDDEVVIVFSSSSGGALTQTDVSDKLLDEEIGSNDVFAAELDESVTSIGDYAFYGCYALTSVYIPNSVTSIGNNTFYNCEALTSVSIPDSMTSIGDFAFWQCKALTSIIIPDSVTSIGDSAFHWCTSLESIIIGKNVEYIGIDAFFGTQIETIKLPQSIKVLERLFNGMENLKNIVFESGVTTISAFSYEVLSNVVNIYIPKSVTDIDGLNELSGTFHVFAFAESFAEKYAKENNMSYTPLPTILPETDMPPDGYLYLPYSFKFKSSGRSWLEIVAGGLPDGLEISLAPYDVKRQRGEIYGAPREWGEFEVTVRATDGNVYLVYDEVTFTIIIADKLPQIELDKINKDRLITPLGVYDDAEDIYIVDLVVDKDDNILLDMETLFNCEFEDFIDLWIDGELQISGEDKDYLAEEGSTRVTLYSQTFSRLDSKTDHVLAGEFKLGGTADGEQYKVAQNFRINKIQVLDPLFPPPDPPPDPPPVPKPPVPDKGGGGGGGSIEKQTEIPTTEQPLQPIPEQITFAGVFSDINETDWFFEDVKWAYEENIMIGVSQTSFAPYGSVSPAMISVTLARIIGVDLSAYDSDNSSWFSAAFAWAYDRGLFAGIDELSHDMPFYRGRLAVALAKLTSDAGLAAPAADRDEDITASDATLKFAEGSDVNGKDDDITASDAELKSAEDPNADEKDDDITASGAALMSADEVGPTDDEITTSDAPLMLAEELDSTGDDSNASKDVLVSAKEWEESIEDFIALDAELMSAEELDAFKLLYHLGILKGRGNGIMDPLNIPTRAELAAILHRLDKYAMELRNIFGALS